MILKKLIAIMILNIKTIKLWLSLLPKMMREKSCIGSGKVTFIGDGFITMRPYGGFDGRFNEAFMSTFEPPTAHHMSKYKYISWRSHIYTWAVQNSMRLEGDCVELGVWWGMLSFSACRYVDLRKYNKKFHLVDAFGLQPPNDIKDTKLEIKSAKYHDDIFSTVKDKFSQEPVIFHRGYVPGVLSNNNELPEKICFLSMDLNNHNAEKAGIEALWDRICVGGYIYIDDYGCQGYQKTREYYDKFFDSKGCAVLKTPYSPALVQKIK